MISAVINYNLFYFSVKMACSEKCFTFTWKLENISYCLQKKNAYIKSPAFVIDSTDETKSHLYLYPRGQDNGNYIGFHLFRERKREIKYELAFVAENGSVLRKMPVVKYDFSTYKVYGFSKFGKREDVFILKRSTFLPQDALIVRCRIWKTAGEMTEDIRCFARTRIGIQRRSFQWSVKKFSTLELEKKYTYEIKSIQSESSLISIDLCLTEGFISEEIIRFKLSIQDPTMMFSTLRLSLVDVSGNRIECNQEELWFDDASKSKEFKFFFAKNKLIAMKNSYLPDDNLSLLWEWALSKGIVSEEIEDIQYSTTTSGSNFSNTESKFPNSENLNNKNIISLSDTLKDLNSLYDENFLCDAKLKTSTRIFNAHKVILSASSSVFKAMFSSDMKEKYSDCVNIENLSDDTINRMLVFIYTAHVEDLTWEKASHLYTAADKYAILSLKCICSSYLKNNLSQSNACDVLLLSDIHAYSDLKSTAQHYILKYIKDIINSDGWKLLMETNSKLAAETLCLQHK
ncbi:unnamed protein product [Larinioides sclopetarius]|uniref:Speckle-type POZ protein n=1 Tax=Larinioides sclopetarius TaxID=280406 RepID=A0AAV2BG36_9ARAC